MLTFASAAAEREPGNLTPDPPTTPCDLAPYPDLTIGYGCDNI